MIEYIDSGNIAQSGGQSFKQPGWAHNFKAVAITLLGDF